MKNIRHFDTIEKYDETKLPYPCISLIENDSSIKLSNNQYLHFTWETNNSVVSGLGVTLLPLYVKDTSLIERIIINNEEISLDYLDISNTHFANNNYANSNLLILKDKERLGKNAITLKIIGEHIFGLPDDNLTTISFENNTNSNVYKNLSINASNFNLIEIKSNTFSNCSGLTSIKVPYSLISIGSSAFKNCSGLTSIKIPYSVTSISSNAFSGCTSLPVVDNIRYADTYLVEVTDKSLSSYNIKEGTKWIGESAFNSCSSLTSITIPNSVTSIGSSAFYYCYSLTSITILDSVTSIGYYAFYECRNLTSITIPNSVTSIGGRAFSSCSSLTSITCLATTAPSITNDTFYYIASNGVLHVPSVSDYSSWMSTSGYYLGYYNWTKQEI